MSAVCPNGHTSQAEDYCDTCGSPIDAQAQPAGGGAGSSGYAADPAPGAAPGAAPAGVAAAAGGSSLDLDPASSATGGPERLVCPNCSVENADGALFCEACGYDFTTGAMPRGAEPAAAAPSGADEPGSPEEPGEPGDGPAESTAAPSGNAAAATSSGATDEGSPSPAFDWVAEVWIDPDWYATQETEDPCPSPGLPTIIPIRRKSVLLGRVSSSRNTHPEIELSSDPGVSRRHAQLTTDGSRWFVEDLGSSNGTFVGPASGPLPDRAIAVGPRTELDDDDRLYVGAWTRIVIREATPDEQDTYA